MRSCQIRPDDSLIWPNPVLNTQNFSDILSVFSDLNHGLKLSVNTKKLNEGHQYLSPTSQIQAVFLVLMVSGVRNRRLRVVERGNFIALWNQSARWVISILYSPAGPTCSPLPVYGQNYVFCSFCRTYSWPCCDHCCHLRLGSMLTVLLDSLPLTVLSGCPETCMAHQLVAPFI